MFIQLQSIYILPLYFFTLGNIKILLCNGKVIRGLLELKGQACRVGAVLSQFIPDVIQILSGFQCIQYNICSVVKSMCTGEHTLITGFWTSSAGAQGIGFRMCPTGPGP